MNYKKILLTILIQMVSLIVIAQKERIRAIYKTSDDFVNNKPSFDNQCNKKKNKIKLNDFFSRPYVTIIEDKNKSRILKRDIFGYLNCMDQVFLFKDKLELLFLNPGEQIAIYQHVTSRPPGKTNVTNFYFSLGVQAPLQNLTIKNLKNAFPGNPSFCILIDKNFKYNTELAEFDQVNKMYKVNALLKKN